MATAKNPAAKTTRARKAASSKDPLGAVVATRNRKPAAKAKPVAAAPAKPDGSLLGRSLDLLTSLVKSDPASTGFSAARTRARRFLIQNGRVPA